MLLQSGRWNRSSMQWPCIMFCKWLQQGVLHRGARLRWCRENKSNMYFFLKMESQHFQFDCRKWSTCNNKTGNVSLRWWYFAWRTILLKCNRLTAPVSGSRWLLTIFRPGFFWSPVARGAQCAPFWKSCSSYPNSLLLSFSESLSWALSHDTLWFPWQPLTCF